MLNNAIITKLKSGTINSVVLFADDVKIPDPPYVVVKSEVGMIPDTRQYRIFVHTTLGQQEKLEEYIFTELPELLSGYLKDDNGRIYILHSGEWSDIRIEDSDKTICMERIFYIPFRIS